MPRTAKHIVVVEDDASLNRALARILEAAGFRATAFLSAEACLAAGPVDDADCLVLDVHLPGMSGIVLHQKLKERQVSPPCVVITAYDDAATREDIKGVPASATLIKPFDGRALVEAIRNALDRCR